MQTGERPALIGRSAELAEWEQLLSALPGRGGVFSVAGEAGIGKTRLAAELARLATGAGARVLRGDAHEGTSGTAYAPLIEALVPLTRTGTALAEDLADPYRSALGLVLPDWRRPDADGDGLVVAEGVLRLLSSVAGAAGAVLIIEDTQWADPDTLAVLDHLSRAASSVPVVLVTTTRIDHAAGDVPVGTPTGAVPRILGRLDGAQQHAMINAVLGGVAEEVSGLVRERAEGLPLAVEEIIADLVRIGGLRREDGEWVCLPDLAAEATAPSIDAMVGGRLTGLPPEALSAATAAAILDDIVTWREIGPVAGLEADAAARALARLAEAQLLTGAGRGRYRYRHGLIRDAVQGWVPPSLVGATAERAARRLEDTGDPSDHATAARLFELADRPAEAAGQYVEAARQCLAVGALRGAEAAAHDALRLSTTAPTTADAADLLAESLSRMGRFAEALAVEVPAEERTGPRAAVAHCRAARCALETGDRDAAREHLDLAERHGGAAGEVTALRATLALESGDRAAATELAAAAVRLAETAAAPELLCAALLVMARVARSEDPGDARPGLERMYETAVAHDLPEWRERALLDLGLLDRITNGRPDRLQQVRKEAAEGGALHTLAVAELNLWPMLLETGDIDEAQRVCDHAALISARYDLRIGPIATAMQAMLAAMRGRFAVAEDIAREIQDHLPARTTYQVFDALCRADPTAALAVLDRVADQLNADLTARPAPARGMHALLCATQSLDPRPAERLRGDGVGTWLNRGLGLLAEAVVAGDRRRLVEADELAGRASADLATAPAMAAIAMAYAAPHALASGWGAPRDWLNAAREQFVLLGNEVMRRHCESIMQQGGLPVPRRGRGDAQVPPRLRALGVTSREMDVLLLVAENLTNAEIAARLSISLRTVDTHVSRLLTKTGRTRRRQLLAFVGPE